MIDFNNLRLRLPEQVRDLPANAGRWMQLAEGYVATLVAGQATFEMGQPTVCSSTDLSFALSYLRSTNQLACILSKHLE